MQIDYYKALLEKDRAYDGRFFFAVTTTKIYCRPICPAKKPKPQNVRIFLTAKDAEKEGFRACLRCRPEAAPGSAAWKGSQSVIARAFRLIQMGEYDRSGLKGLAAKVGLSERHLRRLFSEHLKKSPSQVAIDCRLNLSQELINKSSSSLSEIALICGFKSVRRFNDAFKNSFKISPSQFKRRRNEKS